jgi:crossover junction endodeoxyribonuclease RusA
MIRMSQSEAARYGLYQRGVSKRSKTAQAEPRPFKSLPDLIPPPECHGAHDFAHADLVLRLPWPPTVNLYWRHYNGKTILSKRARMYKDSVASIVLEARARHLWTCRLAVKIDFFPPDHRKRDIDNLQKGLLDSLQDAGVFVSDSQIDYLQLHRAGVVPGGLAVVRILRLEKDL